MTGRSDVRWQAWALLQGLPARRVAQAPWLYSGGAGTASAVASKRALGEQMQLCGVRDPGVAGTSLLCCRELKGICKVKIKRRPR